MILVQCTTTDEMIAGRDQIKTGAPMLTCHATMTEKRRPADGSCASSMTRIEHVHTESRQL